MGITKKLRESIKTGDSVFLRNDPGIFEVLEVRTKLEVRLEGGWFDSEDVSQGAKGAVGNVNLNSKHEYAVEIARIIMAKNITEPLAVSTTKKLAASLIFMYESR